MLEPCPGRLLSGCKSPRVSGTEAYVCFLLCILSLAPCGLDPALNSRQPRALLVSVSRWEDSDSLTRRWGRGWKRAISCRSMTLAILFGIHLGNSLIRPPFLSFLGHSDWHTVLPIPSPYCKAGLAQFYRGVTGGLFSGRPEFS